MLHAQGEEVLHAEGSVVLHVELSIVLHAEGSKVLHEEDTIVLHVDVVLILHVEGTGVLRVESAGALHIGVAGPLKQNSCSQTKRMLKPSKTWYFKPCFHLISVLQCLPFLCFISCIVLVYISDHVQGKPPKPRHYKVTISSQMACHMRVNQKNEGDRVLTEGLKTKPLARGRYGRSDGIF